MPFTPPQSNSSSTIAPRTHLLLPLTIARYQTDDTALVKRAATSHVSVFKSHTKRFNDSSNALQPAPGTNLANRFTPILCCGHAPTHLSHAPNHAVTGQYSPQFEFVEPRTAYCKEPRAKTCATMQTRSARILTRLVCFCRHQQPHVHYNILSAPAFRLPTPEPLPGPGNYEAVRY